MRARFMGRKIQRHSLSHIRFEVIDFHLVDVTATWWEKGRPLSFPPPSLFPTFC